MPFRGDRVHGAWYVNEQMISRSACLVAARLLRLADSSLPKSWRACAGRLIYADKA